MEQKRDVPDRLAYEAVGNGPTLICLHGLGGGAHWFRGLSLRLQDRLRVVSLDLPGTGVNRGTGPFTLENSLEALTHLLRLQPAPVALLGHSMGAILALRLYAAVPDKVGALALVCGLPAVRPAIHKRLSARKERILAGGMSGLGWEAAEGVFSQATLRGNPEVAALFARGFESLDPATYVEGIDALLGGSAEDVVPVAAAPALVLTGSEDAYAPPADARRFASMLPGRVRGVEMDGCGHMPFLESPRLFAGEIASFLAAPAEETSRLLGGKSARTP